MLQLYSWSVGQFPPRCEHVIVTDNNEGAVSKQMYSSQRLAVLCHSVEAYHGIALFLACEYRFHVYNRQRDRSYVFSEDQIISGDLQEVSYRRDGQSRALAYKLAFS